MFAYVGSFTTANRKARGNGINVYRVDPETGAWTHVPHVGDQCLPVARGDAKLNSSDSILVEHTRVVRRRIPAVSVVLS